MTEWHKLRFRIVWRERLARRLDSVVWFFVGMGFVLWVVSR